MANLHSPLSRRAWLAGVPAAACLGPWLATPGLARSAGAASAPAASAAAAVAAATARPSAQADAARFFAPDQVTGARLSPDGRRVAMRSRGPHGRQMLSVVDLATLTPTLVYTSDGADVSRFTWVNLQRLAFTLGDWETPQRRLDAGPGLFGVNADGSGYRQLVERQRAWLRNGNDTRELLPGNTYLLDHLRLPAGDEVLAARPEQFEDNDVDYIRLLRVNTLTGRTTEVDGPTHAVAWWPDARGELRVAVVHHQGQGRLMWRDPASGDWRALDSHALFTEGASFAVRHVAADGRLYVSARRDGDRQAMWLLDPATGRWSDAPLVSSPGFDVDAAVVARQDRVLGLRFTIDAEVTQWLDADMQALQARIDQRLTATANRLDVGWQGDSPWVLVTAFADNQPDLYLLYHRETQRFTRLGAQRPDLAPDRLATMTLERTRSRDGHDLPVWLTRPRGAPTDRPLPTVVLVHGGPWVRGPSWRFDAEAQFLAARGFLVLQPQFRGTQGFGWAHVRRSWRQWGKAMQDDVTDATRWAVAQGLADPKRLAIAGGSYGGYAALMGLVREPSLYRCAVAWAAVTDLGMLHSVNWSDISGSYRRLGLPTLVGDRQRDAEDLQAHSPLTHAARLTQPILLAHGGADRRVPLVHGERFAAAVRPANPQLEWVVYDDEGHGWADPANRLDFRTRMASFLDRHLAPG